MLAAFGAIARQNSKRIFPVVLNAFYSNMSRPADVISPELDPSTLSNYHLFALSKTVLSFKVDWNHQVVTGVADYYLEPKKDTQELVFDTSFLSVDSVRIGSDDIKFSIGERKGPLGAPLTIANPFKAGDAVKLTIDFSTTNDCTALQWLNPEQTSGKKAPYMFSQCQSIHARSLYPCFDTPGLKSHIQYFIQSAHPVVASGVAKPTPESEIPHKDFFSGNDEIFFFDQTVPIPSYLVAVASGDLSSAPIGPRSDVYCEPSNLKACQYEFEADTESFIQTAEKIVFPYEWHTYNVLVLPPSFPFGGMENPNITFATPSLISGDRQNVDVISHELAHSWSGNLVTNCSWEHFWLNEGWTVYLERRILAATHGEEHRHLSAIIGWSDFEKAVKVMDAEFTKLIVNLKGNIDPDDSYSTVPYEKGFNFLFYLENLLGGKAEFDPFIPYYFNKFKYKSLDSYQFKETLYEFFTSKKDILDSIDWDTWFNKPGLPPKPKFDTTLVDEIYSLVNKWISADSNDLSKFSHKDIESWTTTQYQVFLDEISAQFDSVQVSKPDFVNALNKAYRFEESQNMEVTFRYYSLTLQAEMKDKYEIISEWLGSVGRMKYVRPVIRLLNEVDHDLAVKTFNKYEKFYHPICRSMLKKDLNIA